MGKRYVIQFSDADRANQSLISAENAQVLRDMGSSIGRPRGSRNKSHKYEQIRDEVMALHEQGLSLNKIAKQLKVSKRTVAKALHPEMDDDPVSSRQVVAFIRRQLKLMQSVVHDNGGDCSRYTDAYQLLDRLEQRM